jgi:hypothetical protein
LNLRPVALWRFGVIFAGRQVGTPLRLPGRVRSIFTHGDGIGGFAIRQFAKTRQYLTQNI